MTDRERLIELLKNGFFTTSIYETLCTNKRKACDFLADYLLDNGVIVPPVKVGDIVYINRSMSGWYMKLKDRLYEARVAFIRINRKENFMNVVFLKNDNMLSFKFSEIGKTVFLTREEAERALKERENNA